MVKKNNNNKKEEEEEEEGCGDRFVVATYLARRREIQTQAGSNKIVYQMLLQLDIRQGDEDDGVVLLCAYGPSQLMVNRGLLNDKFEVIR